MKKRLALLLCVLLLLPSNIVYATETEVCPHTNTQVYSRNFENASDLWCTDCREIIVENYHLICPHEHTKKTNYLNPACTSSGHTEGLSCLDCYYKLVVSEEIPMGPQYHWYHNQMKITKEPSGDQPGKGYYACTWCGAEYSKGNSVETFRAFYRVSFDCNGGLMSSYELYDPLKSFPEEDMTNYTSMNCLNIYVGDTINSSTIYEYSEKPEYAADWWSKPFWCHAKIPTAVKEGYVLDGWYTEKEGGTEFTADTPITTNMTVYAHWKLPEYHITYNLDGGTNHTDNPTVFNKETDKIVLKNPSKDGYVFLGWYDSNNQAVTTIDPTTEKNYELTAKWAEESKVIISTITYHLYDDEVEQSTYTNMHDTFTLKQPSTGKTGYRFDHWELKDGTRIDSIVKGSTSDYDVYAVWEAVPYSITYNISVAGNPTSYTVEDDNIVLRSAVRRGYTFLGWYDESDQKVETIDTSLCKEIVLKAKFSIDRYRITYVLNGGKQNKLNPYVFSVTTASFTFKPPLRKGYAFAGWYLDKDFKTRTYQIKKGTIGNRTLYAKWTRITVNRLSSLALANSGKISIGAVTGANGYQIQYATNSRFTGAVTRCQTSRYYNIPNIRKGRRYYVRVRAYKIDSSGAKVYGSWSTVSRFIK